MDWHNENEMVNLRSVIETLCYMVEEDSDGVEEVLQLPVIIVEDWIPVKDRLPEPYTEVLVCCEVDSIGGKGRRYICTGKWIPRYCEKALDIDWDYEVTEYDEESDEYYPLEGWYESISNWDDYGLVGINDIVKAWKPLPEIYDGD